MSSNAPAFIRNLPDWAINSLVWGFVFGFDALMLCLIWVVFSRWIWPWVVVLHEALCD